MIFGVNLPIGVLALAGIRFIPSTPPVVTQRVDGVGAMLLSCGLALVVFPLAIGHQYAWPLWLWAMLVGSALVLTVFYWQQTIRSRRGRTPLLHMGVMTDRVLRQGIIVTFAFFAGVLPFFFYLSIYLQDGLGYSALQTGLVPRPFAIAAAAASRTANTLMSRFGRTTVIATALLMMASMAALATIVAITGERLRPGYFIVPLIAAGAAFGTFSAGTTPYVLAQVKPAVVGSASGVLPTSIQLAGSLGVALAGLIFYARLDHITSPATYATAFISALMYGAVAFAVAALVAGRLPQGPGKVTV